MEDIRSVWVEEQRVKGWCRGQNNVTLQLVCLVLQLDFPDEHIAEKLNIATLMTAITSHRNQLPKSKHTAKDT